jgi:hypothetical protein
MYRNCRTMCMQRGGIGTNTTSEASKVQRGWPFSDRAKPPKRLSHSVQNTEVARFVTAIAVYGLK